MADICHSDCQTIINLQFHKNGCFFTRSLYNQTFVFSTIKIIFSVMFLTKGFLASLLNTFYQKKIYLCIFPKNWRIGAFFVSDKAFLFSIITTKKTSNLH